MPPDSAPGYVRDKGHADAEIRCNGAQPFTSAAATPNHVDIGFGKFGEMLMFAVRADLSLASLGPHIGKVVTSRTQEQVVRSNAGRVVAMVQNAQAIRDRTIDQLPRYAMCEVYLLSGYSDTTVASFICAGSPQPAAITSQYFCPESRIERSSHGPN